MAVELLRDLSRQNFRQRGPIPATDEIMAGCQQRIADAMEKMVGDYDRMKANLQMARDESSFYYKRCREKDRKIAALKGVITKLKRKAVV